MPEADLAVMIVGGGPVGLSAWLLLSARVQKVKISSTTRRDVA